MTASVLADKAKLHPLDKPRVQLTPFPAGDRREFDGEGSGPGGFKAPWSGAFRLVLAATISGLQFEERMNAHPPRPRRESINGSSWA